jgi:GTPase SAR1 family protein
MSRAILERSKEEMVYNQAENFINDLGKVTQARQVFSACISQMAQDLSGAESVSRDASGSLGLEKIVDELEVVSENLQEGVFRLLILGDMKRGKSTFLNALLGEEVLPTDVNPCTAVLTVIRYGKEKKVTVYFNDGKEPDALSFEDFTECYTINPEESKKLEEEGKSAFPDIEYAVVEYPLPLLEKRIEIVDSPGLNDTESRNELSLGYIKNCHAVMFVLKATQFFTQNERRYLETYIRGRGAAVFFIINRWDEIRTGLVNPDDIDKLRKSEEKIRQLAKNNLSEYCQVEERDLYQQRVFETSSIQALRQTLKRGSLEGTGFPEFMTALEDFLTNERATAEFRQAVTVAKASYVHVRQAVERRLPLLEVDLDELEKRIKSVEPSFKRLSEIRDNFKEEVRQKSERTSSEISSSCYTYIRDLDKTFEADFTRYQPELNFIDFLRKDKRKEFEAGLRQAFGRYLNEKMSTWSQKVEQDLKTAFVELATSAQRYGLSYSEVTSEITQKLAGKQAIILGSLPVEENDSPAWVKWTIGVAGLVLGGDVTAVGMAGVGLNWQQILINILGANLLSGVVFVGAYTLGNIVLTPPVMIAVTTAFGGALGAWSAEQARQGLIKALKEELTKQLPQIAHDQSSPIRDEVKEVFGKYQKEVGQRMDDDIESLQTELSSLLEQKKTRQINQKEEQKRLRDLESNVYSHINKIETAYNDFLE